MLIEHCGNTFLDHLIVILEEIPHHWIRLPDISDHPYISYRSKICFTPIDI